MADTSQNKAATPEVKPSETKTPEIKESTGGKEVKEATISVGIEAGGIIEGAEIEGTGEVSETEKSTKESAAAGSKGQATAGKAQIKRELTLPPVEKMAKQVEKHIKKEMKSLNKKVKRVVKQRDAHSLNALIAKLRKLKYILSTLATATAERIKELWISYSKESKV